MRRPQLKPGHLPVRRPDGTIWIGNRVCGLGSALTDESGLVWPLCRLLDGTRSPERIAAEMAEARQAEPDEVQAVLDLMLAHGWLIDAAATPSPALDPADVVRHARTVQFLADIDEAQRPNPYSLLEILRGSSVAVLGLGGVGSAVAASLAATGIGRMHLLDFDLIESGNLNRQLLFAEADCGRPKAEVAAERLRALDQRLLITGERRRIAGPVDAAKAIDGADVVFCCVDRPPEVYGWVNEACFRAGIPLLLAGYYGAVVSVATLVPGRTCCFACLDAPQKAEKASRGELIEELFDADFHPVIAASAQIAGNQLALEAIRLLLGMPVQSAGRQLYRNLLDFGHQFDFFGEPMPDCPVGCGRLLAGTAA